MTFSVNLQKTLNFSPVFPDMIKIDSVLLDFNILM